MVRALLVGLGVGFVLAIPPGPMAMACLHQGLAGQSRAEVALARGASAMESVYALLVAWASAAVVGALGERLQQHTGARLVLQGGCCVVLVVMGLHYWRAATLGEAVLARPDDRAPGEASPSLHGVLIALTNRASPTFLPSLLVVMSFVHERGCVGHTVKAHVLYALGFGSGGALWFILRLRLLRHLRAQLSPTVMTRRRRVAGGVFCLFAGLLAYPLVTMGGAPRPDG